ncbi:MAG: hypothetical protein IPI10_18370 [Bacteroidetes bacterium]|nr:hypothetical protein [Bacteroidota bacterium]MBK7573465.1 hypothetical protein [Bacteroidota bacterium]MBK8586671.1 hypothetical protein [Bacteroidota bacterium]MBP9119613.1 hypothetical protein [Ignavibacterium sp.]HQW95007.1 hypothetical protein [Saprospiraceae bacterium]
MTTRLVQNYPAFMANSFEKPPGTPENPQIWTCPLCAGSGKDKNGKTCNKCSGSGKVKDK